MSVAIRAITRVQDADDAPTLGAGQDGYALTWDNASGAFVATALFTGGLLATGATTGATSQAQAFTNGIVGPSWKPSANSTTALQLQSAAGTAVLTVDTANSRLVLGSAVPIMAGTDRLLHRYGTSNFFGGTNAGNFTTTGTGGNVGLGADALLALTDGYHNVGIGRRALANVTSGNSNVALGALAGQNITSGYGNFALGYYSLQAATTAAYNVAIGLEALQSYNPASGQGRSIAIGAGALGSLTTGVNNVAIGTFAGYSGNVSSAIFLGQSAGMYETGDNRLILDSQWRGGTEGGQREGAPLYAEMSSTLTSQLVRVNGVLQSLMTDTATNAVTTQVKISHNSTGTAANGFGAGQAFTLATSTTADQSAARIQALWNDATHATRKADLILTAYDSGGEREGLRIRGDGSGPAVGFYGVAPIARAVLATGAGATVDDVISALQALGLVKQS